MINISKLYCGRATGGDWIRYGEVGIPNVSQRKPVVVWNVTKACNLKCVHCYSDSGADKGCDELNAEEAKTVLDDLAYFGVPVVLFSGGEPLMRSDLFELFDYAKQLGLNTVISTNGTLITAEVAEKIKQAGVSYVGISIDGIGEVNDKFRGVKGAFEKAVEGIRNCRKTNVKVGLRLTLTGQNVGSLEQIFDFVEAEGIERVCFYHLVPSGRGRELKGQVLSHSQTRDTVDTILARAKRLDGTEVLTVDNHVDGVYVYLKLLEEDANLAEEAWRLLECNGGGMYSSGVGIGCIGFDGKVHPDQFWGHYDLGDVRERPFSEIWSDDKEPLLKGLRNRRGYIKGRCKLCKFFEGCGGGLRVQADLHFGDPWAPEPACYLTDEEIKG